MYWYLVVYVDGDIVWHCMLKARCLKFHVVASIDSQDHLLLLVESLISSGDLKSSLTPFIRFAGASIQFCFHFSMWTLSFPSSVL